MTDRECQDALERLRRFLSLILAFGMVGVEAELLLIGHTDAWQQWIPLGLLGVGLVALVVQAVRPTPVRRRWFVGVMLLFVVSGAVGIALHYQGNVEFELEVAPSTSGFALVRAALTGATPALAPGTMTLLGLVGLVAGYRHPSLDVMKE